MVGDAATGGCFVEKRWWVQLWVFWFGDTCGMFSWGYLMGSWIYWSDIQVRELSLSRDLKAICIDNRLTHGFNEWMPGWQNCKKHKFIQGR